MAKSRLKDYTEYLKLNKEKIVELYNRNVSKKDIIKETGFEYSYSSFEGIIKRLIEEKCLIKRKKIVYGKFINDEILIDLHKSGNSLKKISEKGW